MCNNLLFVYHECERLFHYLPGMSSSQVEDDEVFSEKTAVIKSGGSGHIAALISKTRQTGQLQDISKKDRANAAHLQRILSVPEQSSPSTNSSKVTFRSISVSPSGRNEKCSSVVIPPQNKSPSLGISSGERPISKNTSSDQSPDKNQQESNKPVAAPRLVKQSTKGEFSSTNESHALHDDELDSSSPQTSKPIPIPRSSRSRTDSEQKTESSESPVPKPRSESKLAVSQKDEKAKAVKTLQSLLPVGEKQKKEEVVGPDGLTRTERSLQQMQQLMNEE